MNCYIIFNFTRIQKQMKIFKILIRKIKKIEYFYIHKLVYFNCFHIQKSEM